MEGSYTLYTIKVAIMRDLSIVEVLITYYPRESGSKSNLNWITDGWRHLKHILLRAPTLIFLIPGFILFLMGLLLVFLITLRLLLLLNWIESGYRYLPMLDQDIAAFTLLVIGLQTIFYSFFLSMVGGGEVKY